MYRDGARDAYPLKKYNLIQVLLSPMTPHDQTNIQPRATADRPTATFRPQLRHIAGNSVSQALSARLNCDAIVRSTWPPVKLPAAR